MRRAKTRGPGESIPPGPSWANRTHGGVLGVDARGRVEGLDLGVLELEMAQYDSALENLTRSLEMDVTAADDGKNDASTTKRLAMSWVRQ